MVGRGLRAEGRAAAGGEADDLRAAGDLAGDGGRVVAGAVHEDEALRRDLLGVERDVGERRDAALRGGAERLLQDRRQPARLVAGRGVVVHVALVAARVVLPPADAVDELLADRLRCRAADEKLLRAVNLRRLGEHRRAAVLDQDVGGAAERRVGGDAGIAVGAAALERHHQLARRHVGARDDGEGGEQLLDHPERAFDRSARAARFLDRQRVEVILVEAVFMLQPADLHDLAAEPDEDRGGDVRMRGVAPEHALEIVEAVAGVGHAAAGAVRKRDRAVDMRIVRQHAGMVHPVGDHADHGRRAVHGRAERDVVARADAPVGAAEALERRLRRIAILDRLVVDADVVVLVVAPHRAIVDVDVRRRARCRRWRSR